MKFISKYENCKQNKLQFKKITNQITNLNIEILINQNFHLRINQDLKKIIIL